MFFFPTYKIAKFSYLINLIILENKLCLNKNKNLLKLKNKV